MNKISKDHLTVNEENLLELLKTTLYSSDPGVAIRELLQNSHDAIRELPSGKLRQPAIEVSLDRHSYERSISVTDNGIGMNEVDLREKLAVVADGDKLKRAKDNDELIGRFGIGFLSTLIIADTVEVVTQKYGEDKAWRFLLDQTGQYSISPAPLQRGHGTTVILNIGKDRRLELLKQINDLLTEEGMKVAIREWGYLLDIPIRLKLAKNSSPVLVNARKMPWEDMQAAKDTFEDVFGSKNIPLFTYPFAKHNYEGVEYSGVFYFNNQSFFQNSARLYSHGLLVNAENTQIIPAYAPFVHCVIECSALNIDLARRNPENDSVYRVLCAAIHKEFTNAFEKFSQTLGDSLLLLWPNVDNTVISRLAGLLDTGSEHLRFQRDAAEEFLVRCALCFPFYVLDEHSGGQGRPLLNKIEDILRDKKRRLDTNFVHGDVIEIPYTESKVAVEKDILVGSYNVLIDVGRDNLAHDTLIRLMSRYNSEFSKIYGFKVVPVVLPEEEGVTAQEVHELWYKAIELITRSVSFFGREHEVVVERITPEDTPVIISMQDVDNSLIEALRGHVQEVGNTGTQAVSMTAKLDKMLEKMASGGGMMQVRINANNPTMKLLAEAALQKHTVMEAELSLQTITWRAVLDYYGVAASRDMLLAERNIVGKLVITLVNRAERLATAEKMNSELSVKAAKFDAMSEDETGDQREVFEPVSGFAGVVDVADSTRKIFGNHDVDSSEKAIFLSKIISTISEVLEPVATTTGFTGDGITFLIRDDLNDNDCPQVGHKLKTLESSLRDALLSDKRLYGFLNKAGGDVGLRIALDYGDVYRYRNGIGMKKDFFGLPFIKSTRLTTNSDLYCEKKVNLILTDQAYNTGARKGYWQADEFGDHGTVPAKGLHDIAYLVPLDKG